jgi:hypothetical protein
MLDTAVERHLELGNRGLWDGACRPAHQVARWAFRAETRMRSLRSHCVLFAGELTMAERLINLLLELSLKEILKAPIRICTECNIARTQPHDRAWEYMSEWLRERKPPLQVGGLVRGNRNFPHNTREEMKNVQLYFLKPLVACFAKRKPTGISRQLI